MTTACSTDRDLVALATGDGDAATRVHVAACAGCAARLAALERDLAVLTTTLREAPAPAATRHRPWMPWAAAATLAAALLLVTLAPWRAATSGTVAAGDATGELAESLSAALFASADFATAATASDADDVAAALGGGALCTGDGDCTADTLYAVYD